MIDKVDNIAIQEFLNIKSLLLQIKDLRLDGLAM